MMSLTKSLTEKGQRLKAELSKTIEAIDLNLKLLEDLHEIDFYKAEDISQLAKRYDSGIIAPSLSDRVGFETDLMLFKRNLNQAIIFAILQNPNAPIETLEKVAQFDEESFKVLAENPIIDLIILEQPELIENIAKHLLTSKDKIILELPRKFLELLSKSSHEGVRCLVAKNRNTSPEVLAILSQDPDISVKEEVARNLNTPTKVLEQLYSDCSSTLFYYSDRGDRAREDMAKHSKTSPEILYRLAHDPRYTLRMLVSENRNAPPSALNRLAQDPEKYIRESVAKNPNTPVSALKILSRDPFFFIRRAVAENHPTSLSCLTLIKLWLNLPWFKMSKTNKKIGNRSNYIRVCFRCFGIAINLFSLASYVVLTALLLDSSQPYQLLFIPSSVVFFLITIVFLPLPYLTLHFCYLNPKSALH